MKNYCQRVTKKWLENYVNKENVYPQIVEFDPTTNCIYSCPECVNANLLNGPSFKKDEIYKKIDEFHEAGVKGIVFIGGGEPMLYPKFGEVLKYTNQKGIKIGITTSGFFIKKYINEIAEYVDWIRVSLDASNSKSYYEVRPNKFENTFNSIISSIIELNKIKKGLVGVSFLLIERENYNNANEIYDAALLSKKIGCDYFEYIEL